MGFTIMNDIDAVIEVDQVTRIVETAQLLYSTNSWVGYNAEIGCLMSTKKLLIRLHVTQRSKEGLPKNWVLRIY